MKRSSQRISPFRRYTAIASCLLFLLFLSLSQPHRVHHFFENIGHRHHAGDVDADGHDHGPNRTKPAHSDCAVQSATQNCHLGQAALAQLPSVESQVELFHPQTGQWVDFFTAFPFLQRAPPKDTRLA
jgi:hypothetical protein